MRKSKIAREAKKLKRDKIITDEMKARKEFLDSLYDDMKNTAVLTKAVDEMTSEQNENEQGDEVVSK